MILKIKKGDNPDKVTKATEQQDIVHVKDLKNHDVLYALGNVIHLMGGNGQGKSPLQTINGLYEAHKLGFVVTKGLGLTAE
jgi:hypothetical protein